MDYEVVAVDGGGSSTVNENVFAMGGPSGSNSLSNAPVSITGTDVQTLTGWSFKSEKMKCGALLMNDFFSLSATSSSLDPVTAKFRINLDWMTDGETKELVLKRIDATNCEIYPLASSPPTPILPGDTWVDNAVCSYAGWDEYTAREIQTSSKALVYDDTLESFDFKVVRIKTLSQLSDSRSPVQDGLDYKLRFNPNVRSVLVM